MSRFANSLLSFVGAVVVEDGGVMDMESEQE